MPDKLSEETLRKIRDYCRELADRHELDEEAREEICGHLEDKLAGYLSGEVRPTEEDALVLARAHFGDAEEVAHLMTGLPDSAEQRLASRRRTVRRLAAFLAVQTLFVLPFAYLLMVYVVFGDEFISARFYQDTGGMLAICGLAAWPALIICEMGVFLAWRTDLRRAWQRYASAALLLPALLIQWYPLFHGSLFFRFPHRPDGIVPLALPLLVIGLGLSGFAGHLWLLVLVLLPRPRERAPVAAKA